MGLEPKSHNICSLRKYCARKNIFKEDNHPEILFIFNHMLFRTCERERGHLVLQIGTSNGDRAAQVAKKMEQG